MLIILKYIKLNWLLNLDKESSSELINKSLLLCKANLLKADIQTIPFSIEEYNEPKGIVKEQVDNYTYNKYNLLFLDTIGNLLTRQKANYVLKRIVVHTLKVDDITTHTFCTRCIEAGISPVVVQRLMGHESIEITLNRYVSVLKKFKNDELKKLNDFYSNINMFKNEHLVNILPDIW